MRDSSHTERYFAHLLGSHACENSPPSARRAIHCFMTMMRKISLAKSAGGIIMPQLTLQPRPVLRRAGAGDPSFWGEFLIYLTMLRDQGGALSSPSPSANLVGIWKCRTAPESRRSYAGGFLFTPLSRRRRRHHWKGWRIACNMHKRSYSLEITPRRHNESQQRQRAG
jgi:hypothetical protein